MPLLDQRAGDGIETFSRVTASIGSSQFRQHVNILLNLFQGKYKCIN